MTAALSALTMTTMKTASRAVTRGPHLHRGFRGRRSAFRADAQLPWEREAAGEEVEIVEILWTAVVFGFTAGVLGLVAYALVRIATMGRREQH